MRARLESVLNETWYGTRQPGILLQALESVYALTYPVAQRSELRRQAADLVGRPIVVVGNLTAGGSGKTPLVIHLCSLLREAGFKPAVVSRGYGRRGRDDVLVHARQDPLDTGDEPLMIHRRCGVPVLVSDNRIAATRRLFAAGADLVISDDGLQRRRLPRAMELCVISGIRGFGNGRLLPAGPLREPLARLQTVDHVVCNGAASHPSVPRSSVAMRLRPGEPASLADGSRAPVRELIEHSRSRPIEALAGIGDPEQFFALVEGLGIRINRHPFPDHHPFTARDLAQFEGRTILMTEKDAVKCMRLGIENAWYLPVKAELPAGWDAEFIRQVTALAEQEE
jgi:tetraacyldisaccharide 4'-kinase